MERMLWRISGENRLENCIRRSCRFRELFLYKLRSMFPGGPVPVSMLLPSKGGTNSLERFRVLDHQSMKVHRGRCHHKFVLPGEERECVWKESRTWSVGKTTLMRRRAMSPPRSGLVVWGRRPMTPITCQVTYRPAFSQYA